MEQQLGNDHLKALYDLLDGVIALESAAIDSPADPETEEE
jgi:hypothetical protein